MVPKLALLAALATGAGLFASAASGVHALDGRLETAAAMQQQHRLLEQRREQLRPVAFEEPLGEPCDEPQRGRPAGKSSL